jgi:hypothetical protein
MLEEMSEYTARWESESRVEVKEVVMIIPNKQRVGILPQAEWPGRYFVRM